MPTTKLSVTLERGLVQELRRRVGPRGLSPFVNQAVADKIQRIRILEVLDEIEADSGAPSAEDRKCVAAELERLSRVKTRRKRR